MTAWWGTQMPSSKTLVSTVSQRPLAPSKGRPLDHLPTWVPGGLRLAVAHRERAWSGVDDISQQKPGPVG